MADEAHRHGNDAGASEGRRRVRVLVVGGLARLSAFYRSADFADLDVDAVNGDCPTLEARAEAADAVVLVVPNVSHAAAVKVRGVARRRNVALVTVSSPGVGRVRATISGVRGRMASDAGSRRSALESGGRGREPRAGVRPRS